MKKNNKSKSSKPNKLNKKLLLGSIVVIVIIVVVIIEIVIFINKDDTTVTSGLNTEVWLGPNETVGIDNGADNIVLRIDSDLNYVEGEEFEVPYTLIVNEVEYKGTYRFATGYSIHSEPNNIPYKVDFNGIETGKVSVMVTEN